MPIVIGHNIASLAAQRRLKQANDAQSASAEKLASGLRINRASDDAAGLAISQSLKASGKVFTQAVRNLNDGLSFLAIAQSALSELTGITQRQIELAEQAANGAYSATQRRALQKESDQLTLEYRRIIEAASFNGRQIFQTGTEGVVTLQGGTGQNAIYTLDPTSALARSVGNSSLESTTASTLNPGFTITDYTSGDFNNDGKIDFVTNHANVSMRVYFGNGDLTFTSGVLLPGVDSMLYTDQVVGDFNGDGNLDVLGSTSDWAPALPHDRYNLFFGNGNGTFQAAVTGLWNMSGTEFSGIRAVDDFNNDGKTDILRTTGDGVAQVLLSRGNGTFTSGATFSNGSSINITSGDVNGDGNSDILIIDGTTLGVRLGNGTGSFAAPIQTTMSQTAAGVGESSLVSADFDRDGNSDVAFLASTGSVVIGYSDGRGGIRTQQQVSPGISLSFITSFSVQDGNGDGLSDIAYSSGDGASSTMVVLQNQGDAKGFSVTGGSTKSTTDAIRPGADFNGDGALDYIALNTNQYWNFFAGQTATSLISPFLDLSSATDARTALTTAQRQAEYISAAIGKIGSLESRINFGVSNLQSLRDNYQAAESRIVDVDVAYESSRYLISQILQQSAAAILAQANQLPNLALLLLKN